MYHLYCQTGQWSQVAVLSPVLSCFCQIHHKTLWFGFQISPVKTFLPHHFCTRHIYGHPAEGFIISFCLQHKGKVLTWLSASLVYDPTPLPLAGAQSRAPAALIPTPSLLWGVHMLFVLPRVHTVFLWETPTQSSELCADFSPSLWAAFFVWSSKGVESLLNVIIDPSSFSLQWAYFAIPHLFVS